MPNLASSGFDLYYQEEGQGPALVLLHGWAASGSQWQQTGWTSQLTDRRILMPDVRGHGQSAHPHAEDAYVMEALAGDVIALLDAERQDQADLFGYSMGGAIALWVATLWPARVRSLIIGGVGGDPFTAAALGRELQGLGPPTERGEAYRAYAKEQPDADLVALAACLATGLPAPPCVELAIFGGEALVAAGTDDRRYTATESLAGCLPGGRFLRIEEADHMGAFVHRSFMQAVAEFLDEVSPPVTVTLVAATVHQRAVLDQLLQLYLYEFSHLDDRAIGEDGRYPYLYLDRYWSEPGRYPFLIREDGALAGFALIIERELVEPDAVGHDMAEFFVLRKLRRHRIGESAVCAAFDAFPGHWWVEVHPSNRDAQHFWRAVVRRYTSGAFEEQARNGAEGGICFTFETPQHPQTPSL